jgi:secreted protein with Ig-like and vWFA domain
VIGAITAGLFSTGVAASTNAYESIATQVLSSSSSSVTFSSIPSTYKHLQIRVFAQGNRGTYSYDEAFARFNSDSTTSYAYHVVYGTGSAAATSASSTRDNLPLGNGFLGTTTGGTFGINIIDILDYADTNKYKTVRVLGGEDANGSGQVGLGSGLWQKTTAISTILLSPNSSTLFSTGSSFALYGIKG